MGRYCSVPKIFGLRKWFEARYKLCCEKHDYDYATKFNRKQADIEFLICMLNCSLKRDECVIIPIGAYIAVRLFGWHSWRYKGS